jgi:hypothetical protein
MCRFLIRKKKLLIPVNSETTYQLGDMKTGDTNIKIVVQVNMDYWMPRISK